VEQLVPRDQAFDLFQRSGRRVERVLSALPGHGVSPDTPIPHLEWSVGDLAAHLVQALDIAGGLLQGRPSPYTDMHRIAEVNARLLEDDPERDLQVLLPEFSRLIRAMESRFRKMPDDFQVPFHSGWIFTPAEAMAMMSSELLIHGWDLAQVIGEDFKIPADDARLIFNTILPLTPRMVVAENAAGFTATYEVTLRGGETFRLHFENGDLNVSHVNEGGPADCRISAEPTAFLLMGRGRGSQIMPILTGKVVAWGRKPWLAAKFTSLVSAP
jgi:uncharacterized protein (TIGR03083 family)